MEARRRESGPTLTMTRMTGHQRRLNGRMVPRRISRNRQHQYHSQHLCQHFSQSIDRQYSRSNNSIKISNFMENNRGNRSCRWNRRRLSRMPRDLPRSLHLLGQTLPCLDLVRTLKSRQSTPVSRPGDQTTSNRFHLRAMRHLRASHRGPLCHQLRRLPLFLRQLNYNNSLNPGISIGIFKWEKASPVGLHLAASPLAAHPIQRRLQLMISTVHGEKCRQGRLESSLIPDPDATSLFLSSPEKVPCETSKLTVAHPSCKGRSQESKEDLQSRQRRFKLIGLVVKMLVDLGHAAVLHLISVEEAVALRVACPLAALMQCSTPLMVDESHK